jgi:hypothetical protein
METMRQKKLRKMKAASIVPKNFAKTAIPKTIELKTVAPKTKIAFRMPAKNALTAKFQDTPEMSPVNINMMKNSSNPPQKIDTLLSFANFTRKMDMRSRIVVNLPIANKPNQENMITTIPITDILNHRIPPALQRKNLPQVMKFVKSTYLTKENLSLPLTRLMLPQNAYTSSWTLVHESLTENARQQINTLYRESFAGIDNIAAECIGKISLCVSIGIFTSLTWMLSKMIHAYHHMIEYLDKICLTPQNQ